MVVVSRTANWLMPLSLLLLLLLAGASAMAQKKPGGGGSDTCAAAVGFPAFIYWQQSSKSQQIFVADETGKCSRPIVLVTGSGGAGSARFSMLDESHGRVVFPDVGGVISAVDFTVEGTDVAVNPKRTVAQSGCCSLDLSRDGRSLYVPTETDEQGMTTLRRIDLDETGGASTPVVIRTLQGHWAFWGISVDASGGTIYTDEQETTGAGKRLMRIDVALGSAEELVTGNGVGEAPYDPAASTEGDQFAYAYSLEGFDRCYEIRVASSDGTPAPSLAPARYGTNLTWLDGDILATERRPPDGRGRCAASGNITRISPDGTTSTVLVRGYDPDAR